jgi:hypothetical protein
MRLDTGDGRWNRNGLGDAVSHRCLHETVHMCPALGVGSTFRCFAVTGQLNPCTQANRPLGSRLVLHWDGSVWTQESAQLLGGGIGFSDVTTGASRVWVSGSSESLPPTGAVTGVVETL